MKKDIDENLLNKTESEIQEYIKDKKVFMTFKPNGIKWDRLYVPEKDGYLTKWMSNKIITKIECI
jgi:hypothetical protein